MKKTLWVLIGVFVIAAGYVMAAPYITTYQIRSAIDAADAERLAAHVDFPVLRQNLKEQLNAEVKREIKPDNPFAALAGGFAAKLVDSMVESFITPEGLSGLMQGRQPAGDKDDQDHGLDREDGGDHDTQARYTSINDFRVTVENRDGGRISFILQRYGLGWKLTDINLDGSG